jgi:hypothetical protein
MTVATVALTAMASAVLLGLGHYRQVDKQLSSDGDRYLTMGRGEAVPYPFMFRWLIPAICREVRWRWRLCTDLHLVALPPLTTLYLLHWSLRPAAAAAGGLLICGFAGIWRNNIRRPVLVDPPALWWALLAGVLAHSGHWLLALLVAALAAAMKETAPVFAACFGLAPVLLVALVVPLVRRVLARGGEDTHHSQALADPLGSARRAHAEHLFDPVVMLAPWGAGLLAVLVDRPAVALVLVLSCVAGYGQLATAVNTVRLYQWAGPAVALAAASVLPVGWEPAVLLAHLFNPWAGNGR